MFVSLFDCDCVLFYLHSSLYQALKLVASCAESDNSVVQLGVLRAILTALTSQYPSSDDQKSNGEVHSNATIEESGDFVFHGEPVMIGIRVCYNIAVGSEVVSNRSTARSALLQLMSSIAKRAKYTKIEISTKDDDDGDGNDNDKDNDDDSEDIHPKVKAMIDSVITSVVEGHYNKDADSGKEESPLPKANGSTVEAHSQVHQANGEDESGVDSSKLAKWASQADVSAIEKALHVNDDEGNVHARNAQGDGSNDISRQERDAQEMKSSTEGLHHSVRDLISVFRALAKLGARDVGSDETALKGKVLAINLLTVLLESMDANLAEIPIIKKLLQRHACVTILRNSISKIPSLLESIAAILSVLALRFRRFLKTELGALLPLLFIRPLESEVSVVQRMSALLELQKLLRNPAFVADIFFNYDCDMAGANLYERLIVALSALVGQQTKATSNNNNTSSVSSSTVAAKALHCLLSVIDAMYDWATKSAPGGQIVKVVSSGSIDGDGQKHNGDIEYDQVGLLKAAKTTLETGVIAFNSNPSKGIRLMTAAGIIDGSTTSIAKFLRETHGLDKSIIGDFVGHHDPEKIEILKEYTNMMNFTDQPLDEALRTFCFGFRLPGEAQKIDRIVERFAERYCENNPGIFKSTDAAYVLSFAIVMLNTDAHNPQVTDKMSKDAFLGMTKDTDAESVPRELLEGIYDRIVKNEIKLKDESDASKPLPKAGQRPSKIGSSGLFSWARSEQNEQKQSNSSNSSNMSAVQNAREMIIQAQACGDEAKDGFKVASLPHIVKPMIEVTGGLLLRTLQIALQSSKNVDNVVDTIHGLHTIMRIASLFDIDGPLEAAFNTILLAAGSETMFLPQQDIPKENAIAEIMLRVSPKQCIASKMILQIAVSELSLIGNSNWSQVLHHLSAHSLLLSHLEQVEKVPAIKLNPKTTKNEDLSSFNSSHGPPKYFQWLKSGGKSLLNNIFLSTKELNDESISHCIAGMIEVSRNDMKDSPSRTWMLSRLVEVTETNTWRLRIVWNRIWHRVGEYLIEIIGNSHTPAASIFALKALMHISTRALIRDKDFAHANFQADTLRYIVPAMRMNSVELRSILLDKIGILINEHGAILYSGWRLIFSALAVIARDRNKASRSAALQMASDASKRMFLDIAADCLPDVTNCLSTFTNGDTAECMIAIRSLKECGVSMAKRGTTEEGNDTTDSVTDNDIENKSLDEHFVIYGVYWIGLFVTFSEHSMDRRPEIRRESLLALLELIRDYSKHFNEDLWKSIFSSALLPLLDPIRSTMEGNEEAWLVDALLDRAPALSSLLLEMYPLSSTFLPQVYAVLLDGAQSVILPSIASISVKVFLKVFECMESKLNEADTSNAMLTFRKIISETFPSTLIERATQESNVSKQDILKIVFSVTEAQQCMQSSLIAMSDRAMKNGNADLAWETFDLIVEQAKLISSFTSLQKSECLRRLQCDGISSNTTSEILSSLSEIETSGWQACVTLLETARVTRASSPLSEEEEIPVYCLKHIALVESILASDNERLSDMALSIISSLDQLDKQSFSFAMQKLFLDLAKLTLSEQAAARQLYHKLLVTRIWPEIKDSL